MFKSKQALNLINLIHLTGIYWLILWGMALCTHIASIYDYRFSWLAIASVIAGLFIGKYKNFATGNSIAIIPLILLAGLVLFSGKNTFLNYILLILVLISSTSIWISSLKDNTASNWFSLISITAAISSYPFILNLINSPIELFIISAILLLIHILISHYKNPIVILTTTAGIVGILLAQNHIEPDNDIFTARISSYFSQDWSYSSSHWDSFSRKDHIISEKKTTPPQITIFRNGFISKKQLDLQNNKGNQIWTPLLTINPKNNQKVLLINPENSNIENIIRNTFSEDNIQKLVTNCHSEPDCQPDDNYHLSYQDTDSYNNYFDKIIFINPERTVKHWVAPINPDEYVFTQQAISNIVKLLNNDGMIYFLSSNELNFQKSLISLWDGLLKNQKELTKNPIMDIWAFRSISVSENNIDKIPYEYIVLANKTPSGQEFSTQLKKVARSVKNISVENNYIFSPIMGMGFTNNKYYKHLQARSDIAFSEKAFEQMQSKKHQQQIHLATQSYATPQPFAFIRTAHKYLKWFLLTCLACTAGIFLFSAPSLRRINAIHNKHYAPVPIYLSYFLLAGILLSSIITSSLMLASIIDNKLLISLAIIPASIFTGLAINRATDRPGNDNSGRYCIIFIILLLSIATALTLGIEPLIDNIKSDYIVLLILAILLIASTLLTKLIFTHGDTLVLNHAAELDKWSQVIKGLSFLIGTTLSVWLPLQYGVANMFYTLLGMASLLIVITLWLGEPRPTN